MHINMGWMQLTIIIFISPVLHIHTTLTHYKTLKIVNICQPITFHQNGVGGSSTTKIRICTVLHEDMLLTKYSFFF